jgi:hypothetical protein
VFAREVDAYVISDVEPDEPVALDCTGRLSIAPGEIRFEPRTEHGRAGEVPASDPRPVVHRAIDICLTEHYILWMFFVFPAPLGSQLMVIDDSRADSARQANICIGNRRLRWRVHRALRACGFRVEVVPYPRPDEGSTLELD